MLPPRPAVQSAISVSITSHIGNRTTHVECQTIRLGRKGNLRSLGEIEHIAGTGSDLLACLIRDLELPLQDDLHLIVGVGVDERGTLLQTVEATRDGLLGIVLVAGGY